MAYSEFPWRPFLGHQPGVELNYTKKRYVFYYVYKRLKNIFSRFFFVFNVFKFLFERLYIYADNWEPTFQPVTQRKQLYRYFAVFFFLVCLLDITVCCMLYARNCVLLSAMDAAIPAFGPCFPSAVNNITRGDFSSEFSAVVTPSRKKHRRSLELVAR